MIGSSTIRSVPMIGQDDLGQEADQVARVACELTGIGGLRRRLARSARGMARSPAVCSSTRAFTLPTGGRKLCEYMPIHTIITISGITAAHSRTFRSGTWCLHLVG